MTQKLEQAFVGAVDQDTRVRTDAILTLQGYYFEKHVDNEGVVFSTFWRWGSRFIPVVLSESDDLFPDNALATGLEVLR